ncbi:MAG TPA: IS1595 family transposase [Bacteroidia bacterium]|nr:IS1595 family transposase [Bacteroidia bacterium]
MEKYTIKDLRKDYPHEAACLDKLFELCYGELKACPKCGVEGAEFRRITTRRCYQCRECYHQLYPTAGTIFDKTRTPLTYWFYAMFLMTTTRNGVSAKELERALGVTYKTAWRMAISIRELMGRKKKNAQLKGTVEMDETYFNSNRDLAENHVGRNTDKGTVFAMVERHGNVTALKVEDTKKTTLFPIIEDNVDKSAKIMTDEYKTYTNLETLGYDHKTIRHGLKQYVNGAVSTNTVEGFFSQLKRTVRGTHIWISKKYLQQYVDECCFRYNNREKGSEMFDIMLSYVY